MVTLRFDYIIILMFSNGIWSAFLATPVLALQLEPPSRVVHRIVILAVEWTTMILWFVCFLTLATISPTSHCDIRSCTEPRVMLFLGATEWYAMLTPTELETTGPYTLPAELMPQLLIIRLLGCYSWLPRYTASQLLYRFAGLSGDFFPTGRIGNNQLSKKSLEIRFIFSPIPQYTH
jgi:hypothetical protein